MKTIKNSALFAASIIILSACDGLGSQAVSEWIPSWHYELYINFRSTDGNDLVAPLGIERYKTPVEIAKGTNHWGGQINPDKYSLEIIVPNPPSWWDNTIYNTRAYPGYLPDVHHPRLETFKYDANHNNTSYGPGLASEDGDGYYYLITRFGLLAYREWYEDGECVDKEETKLQDYLTYQFKCPTIFGDEEIHELKAWWKYTPSENTSQYRSRYPECVRIEFGGKEYTPAKVLTQYINLQEEDIDTYRYFIDIVLNK